MAIVIAAGLHPFDITASAQTVNGYNPQYQKVLHFFKELTDYSGFLNTSFNLHGFPIVGSPEIAIETLLKSDLSALAIENYIVTKI